MAETSNRQLGTPHADDTPAPSAAQVVAAINETRLRLAARLTRTADHVNPLYAAPASAHAEAGRGGVIEGAVKAIAVVGRAKRAWDDARRTGVLRRAAVGAAGLAIAAVLVAKRRDHS
jgi:hypothetical protein